MRTFTALAILAGFAFTSEAAFAADEITQQTQADGYTECYSESILSGFSAKRAIRNCQDDALDFNTCMAEARFDGATRADAALECAR